MSRYIAPSKRREEIQANPLAPENYPSLGGSLSVAAAATAKSATPLNFLKRIQESEEERRRREELAASLDPNGIQGLSKATLEERGWALFSLSQDAVREACERIAKAESLDQN